MRHLPLLAACGLAACGGPATFPTDNGQLEIGDEGLVDLVADGGGPSALLVGTEMCPVVSVPADASPSGDYDALACFAQSIEGPVVQEAECFTVTEPGVVEWSFTAQPCAGNDFGYTPVDDSVSIDVVAASDVEGRLPMHVEDLVEELAASSQAYRLEAPADWRVADGAAVRIVAGSPFDVRPGLRTLTDGANVAWRGGELTGDGGVSIEPQPTTGVFRLVAEPGETATLTLTTGGSSVGVGAVEGVSVDDIVSLELAVLSTDLGPEAGSLPLGARAVARDAAGEVVLGAPVEWRFSKLVLTAGPDGATLPGADYVMFGEECTDPGRTVGEQRGTLTARVGNVSATRQIVWTPRLEAEPVEGWTRPEECQAACGCASGRGAPALSSVVLAAVLLRRRRRA